MAEEVAVVRQERAEPAAVPEEVVVVDVMAVRDRGRPDRLTLLAEWLPSAPVEDFPGLWEAWKDDPSATIFRRLLLARWVELDVGDARRMAGDGDEFWEAWVALDPQAAFQAALASKDVRLIGRVKRLLAKHNPELARKLAEAEDIAMTEDLSADGYVKAGRFAEAIEAVSGTPQRARVHDYFIEWLAADPVAAFTWAASTGFTTGSTGIDDEKRMVELVRAHAQRAEELVGLLPAGEFRSRVEVAFVTALAETDQGKARAFVATLKSPLAKKNAMASLGIGLTKSDPDAALVILEELVDGGARRGDGASPVLLPGADDCESRDNAFDPFVEALMAGLPERTMDSAMAWKNGEAQDRAMSVFADQWMSGDLWGFSKWLATKPPGGRRDLLAGRLVYDLLAAEGGHYEEAAEWVGAIGDAGVAEERALMVVAEWRRKDRAGLEAYVRSGKAPVAIQTAAKQSD